MLRKSKGFTPNGQWWSQGHRWQGQGQGHTAWIQNSVHW